MKTRDELKRVTEHVSAYEKRLLEAYRSGEQFARRIHRMQGKYEGADSMTKAHSLAGALATFRWHEVGQGCFDLILQWAFDKFWGDIVRNEVVPEFTDLHGELTKVDARPDSPLIWGDVDFGAWVERCKDSERKVICVTSYSSCADDNTHVYILDRRSFHIRTAYPKLRRHLKGKGWDYVDRGSLSLYRTMEFKCQYGDCRDPQYILSFDGRTGRADRVESKGPEIKCALSNLYMIQNGLDSPCEMPTPCSSNC